MNTKEQIQNIRDIIGSNIRHWRMFREMKQEELARKCNCDRSTISRYETGDGCPTVDLLLLIAAALDLELMCFLVEDYPDFCKTTFSGLQSGIDSLRSDHMAMNETLKEMRQFDEERAKAEDRLLEYYTRTS